MLTVIAALVSYHPSCAQGKNEDVVGVLWHTLEVGCNRLIHSSACASAIRGRVLHIISIMTSIMTAIVCVTPLDVFLSQCAVGP